MKIGRNSTECSTLNPLKKNPISREMKSRFRSCSVDSACRVYIYKYIYIYIRTSCCGVLNNYIKTILFHIDGDMNGTRGHVIICCTLIRICLTEYYKRREI